MAKVLGVLGCSLLFVAVVGCGGGADAKKEMPPVTPAEKQAIDEQHEAMKKANAGGGAPAGDANK